MKILTFDCQDFNGVTVNPLVDTDNVKEIQICMQKDSQMKEHKAPGSIMVQVLKGEIDFFVNKEKHNLKYLDMILLDANVVHSLIAKEDSIVRLSLSKNDNSSRVFSVLK